MYVGMQVSGGLCVCMYIYVCVLYKTKYWQREIFARWQFWIKSAIFNPIIIFLMLSMYALGLV